MRRGIWQPPTTVAPLRPEDPSFHESATALVAKRGRCRDARGYAATTRQTTNRDSQQSPVGAAEAGQMAQFAPANVDQSSTGLDITGIPGEQVLPM